MDRSLKERVIGASVLVVLAVWLIPWVLDGPVPDAEPGAAQSPVAENSAPLRTQTIRLENQPIASAPSGAPDIPGLPTPQASEDFSEVARELSSDAPPEVATTPVAGRVTAEVRADATSGSAAAVPADVPRDVGNESGSAAPVTGSAAASSVAPGSGWLVQVGSFSDEENARRLADRLDNVGYAARLYPHGSGGGLMYRVRVGPEASREGADEIASSLRDRGFLAQVVSSD